MANPLPAARSFFPYTQARGALRRQALKIDRFLCRNHIGNHNVVVIHGRFKIAKRYLADAQFFDQCYFTGTVAGAIHVNGLKALSYLSFHSFPILRLDVFPHLSLHLLAVVGRLVHFTAIRAGSCSCQISNLPIAKCGRDTRLDRAN